MFFSCFLVFLTLLFVLPNNGCPTILILVSKVGIDRTDSLGTGTVIFCVLSGWYSSTLQCDSSTVALDRRLTSEYYHSTSNLDSRYTMFIVHTAIERISR